MKIQWYLWILFAMIVVLVYPKPCGTIIPSKVLEYSCIGFQTPLMGLLQKPDVREQWCSGICSAKSLDPEKYAKKNITQSQETMGGGPLSGIMSSMTTIIPTMILIGGIIGVVMFINSMQKKTKSTSNITVIKGPGQ